MNHDINTFDHSGEYFDMCHVVGDETSELQLCEMDISVVFRNMANAAVRNMLTLPTTPQANLFETVTISRNTSFSCGNCPYLISLSHSDGQAVGLSGPISRHKS